MAPSPVSRWLRSLPPRPWAHRATGCATSSKIRTSFCSSFSRRKVAVAVVVPDQVAVAEVRALAATVVPAGAVLRVVAAAVFGKQASLRPLAADPEPVEQVAMAPLAQAAAQAQEQE